MSAICTEGELTDEKDLSVAIGDRAVHFVSIIGKNTEFGDFIDEDVFVAFCVILGNTQENQVAILDGRDAFSFDGNASAFDALYDSFHGNPFGARERFVRRGAT